MKIGPYTLPSNVVLAPMAGVTDRPFRILCRRFGAGLAASEMLTADVRLWDTPKSRRRMDHRGEPGPRVVQIAGFDPSMMAEAARRNVDAGAQIIDINMGCPAKKVCNRLSGSALLQDEALVARILHSVVRSVDVPVTLKTRFCLGDRKTARLGRIDPVERGMEQALYLVNGQSVLGDIDIPKLGAILARFVLLEVLVTGSGKTNFLLGQMSLHFHSSGS